MQHQWESRGTLRGFLTMRCVEDESRIGTAGGIIAGTLEF